MNALKRSNTTSALRRTLLYAITLSIPMLFFILLEGGLRLAGYGESYPLFIPVDEAPGYLMANPAVVKRFVVDESRTPDVFIRPVRFPEQKTPDTFRIFVQGGSSAAGWPYGFGASLAGMLQQRLNRTFPGRNIEVITTAMIAVNSYTLLEFTEEIIAQQPDAVLIYAGHNEFLGILGVGSAVSAGRTRPVVLAYLALRELRILQLMKNVYHRVTRRELPEENNNNKTRKTLMHRIVDESHIPRNSPLYHQGMAQFHSNLTSLLERYQTAGIPVFIGTLVSNEKDLEPFISGLAPGTNEAAWRLNYKTGVQAFRNGDPEAARAALEETVSLDDTAARGYFTLGKVLEGLEDYPAARQAYLAAKDRDQLRFRAPEVFNPVIRELAAAYGARVVEVQDALLDQATNGIIGNELLLEHLHPNLEGYFLLADTFFESLRKSGMIASRAQTVSRDQAWNEIPITEVDRLKAEYEIVRLQSDWPFQDKQTSPPYPPRETYIKQLAYSLFKGDTTWTRTMKKLLSHYMQQQNNSAATRVAVLLADTYPYVNDLQYVTGSMVLEAGQPHEAVRLLQRALRQNPDQPDKYLIALVSACRAGGDEACTRQTLARLREVNPDHPQIEALTRLPDTVEDQAEEEGKASFLLLR